MMVSDSAMSAASSRSEWALLWQCVRQLLFVQYNVFGSRFAKIASQKRSLGAKIN